MATEGAATLRRVLSDVTFGWDGAVARYPAGMIVQVEPGSVLEAYIGAGNLEDVPAGQLGRGETLDKSFLAN